MPICLNPGLLNPGPQDPCLLVRTFRNSVYLCTWESFLNIGTSFVCHNNSISVYHTIDKHLYQNACLHILILFICIHTVFKTGDIFNQSFISGMGLTEMFLPTSLQGELNLNMIQGSFIKSSRLLHSPLPQRQSNAY